MKATIDSLKRGGAVLCAFLCATMGLSAFGVYHLAAVITHASGRFGLLLCMALAILAAMAVYLMRGMIHPCWELFPLLPFLLLL